jgi:hypothetical protein
MQQSGQNREVIHNISHHIFFLSGFEMRECLDEIPALLDSRRKLWASTIRNMLLVPALTVCWILLFDPEILGEGPVHKLTALATLLFARL